MALKAQLLLQAAAIHCEVDGECMYMARMIVSDPILADVAIRESTKLGHPVFGRMCSQARLINTVLLRSYDWESLKWMRLCGFC